MDMEKGIPELVEAMAHLRAIDGKEPLLLCVGGPMEVVPSYLNLAESLGVPEHRLQFVDRVANSQVPYWIQTFDLAVAPFPNKEHYAYFMSPMKLFEYMASGVPIVASDLPSIREVLRHGENALLVKPNHPKLLVKNLEQILDNYNLARGLGNLAQANVQVYTWENRAKKMLTNVEKLYE
jgi:glycosyltransferase involved in cell wall biosynthesis